MERIEKLISLSEISVSADGSTWFLGPNDQRTVPFVVPISVSADGSTWFLGTPLPCCPGTPASIFQYPLMDRLGFWGEIPTRTNRRDAKFQYPLMDRLGFWGAKSCSSNRMSLIFQYPLMDRLGFWGGWPAIRAGRCCTISVSADGSTWFLGHVIEEYYQRRVLHFSIR